jgi:hypothetical protein
VPQDDAVLVPPSPPIQRQDEIAAANRMRLEESIEELPLWLVVTRFFFV